MRDIFCGHIRANAKPHCLRCFNPLVLLRRDKSESTITLGGEQSNFSALMTRRIHFGICIPCTCADVWLVFDRSERWTKCAQYRNGTAGHRRCYNTFVKHCFNRWSAESIAICKISSNFRFYFLCDPNKFSCWFSTFINKGIKLGVLQSIYIVACHSR